jgi:signal transduction histidine kinase/ligand-binding sensor domain-containing protein
MRISSLRSLASVVFFSLACGAGAFCQVLPFHYYTTRDGLTSNAVRALFQDSHGYLWVGTNNGVSVYDGTGFVNYTAVDGLPNNLINCIAESRVSPGTMLIGTNGAGIARCTDRHFTAVPIGTTLASNSVDAIVEDESGAVWCATDEGVYVLRDGASPAMVLPFHSGRVMMTRGGDGRLWVSTLSSAYVVSAAGAGTLTIRPAGRATFECVARSRDGDVWIGSSDGRLLRYRGASLVETRSTDSGPVLSILDDGRGDLLVSSNRGLLKISRDDQHSKRITLYTAKNGLQENAIPVALIDSENDLWLGSWSKGLSRLGEQTVSIIPTDNLSYQGNWEASAAADTAGHIWEATSRGLLEVFRDIRAEWRKVLHPLFQGGLPAPAAFLAFDSHCRLWVSTRRNPELLSFTVRHSSGNPSVLSSESARLPLVPFPGHPLSLRFIDREDHAWCGSDSGVVVVDIRTMRTVRFTPPRLLSSISVRGVCEDRRGNVWIGWFADGVSRVRFEGGTVVEQRWYGPGDGLPDREIRCMHEDRRGEIWAGTRYGGLACLRGDRFSALTMRDGLLSNAVWSIAEDGDGRVWIATDAGLQPFDASTAQPLPAKTELLGRAAIVCGVYRNDFVWFVSEDAVEAFEYSGEERDTVPPPAYVTAFLVNGRSRPVVDGTRLPGAENTCTVGYAGLSLRDGRKVRYQYRLLGIESEWNRLTDQRSVTYAALPPGSYRFEVMAFNGDGVASAAPAALSFVILPPLWRTWWFILVCLGGVSFAATMIIRARVNRLLHVERIRSRIATDLHDDIGASLTRIALFSDAARAELRANHARAGSRGTRHRRLLSLLAEMSGTARELVDSMSDIVWAVDPKNDAFEDLLLRMKTYAGRILGAKNIDYRIDVPAGVADIALPLEYRRNLFLMFKEALNNVVRHSHASKVEMSVFRRDGHLVFTISDNGRGFGGNSGGAGNGIRNMKQRALLLNGELTIDTSGGRGTTLTLTSRIP